MINIFLIQIFAGFLALVMVRTEAICEFFASVLVRTEAYSPAFFLNKFSVIYLYIYIYIYIYIFPHSYIFQTYIYFSDSSTTITEYFLKHPSKNI